MSDSGISTTPKNSNHMLPVSSSNNDLEDIQYLLYLETLKRFKDEEAHIRRQAEDKIRQYQETTAEHINLYAKYVSLMELVSTRNAMEHFKPVDEAVLTTTKANVANINSWLGRCELNDYIDSEALAQCKEILSQEYNYDNLPDLKTELMAAQTSMKRIRGLIESLESNLETGIVHGLDCMIAQFKVPDTSSDK